MRKTLPPTSSSTLRTLSCYRSPPISRPPPHSGDQRPRLTSSRLRSRLHHQSAPSLSPPPSSLRMIPPPGHFRFHFQFFRFPFSDTLLHPRSQSILSFLVEDSDANR